jgi:hypothetical protein
MCKLQVKKKQNSFGMMHVTNHGNGWRHQWHVYQY